MSTEENPYEPPSRDVGAANAGKPPAGRWRLITAIFLIAAVATALTFALPFVAVPVALLSLPAALRILRIRAVRQANHVSMDARDRMRLLLISLAAAIPIGAASLVLFCCVCTPTGFVTMTVIGNKQYGPDDVALATAVFLSLIPALWFGQFLMRREEFLSQEVKAAAGRGET